MLAAQHRPPSTATVPCSVWFGPVVSAGEERELIEHLRSQHGVGVCCWPRDADRVAHLAAAHVPRLLLVGSPTAAPEPAAHQAWLVRSASNAEVHEALVGLCRDADARDPSLGIAS